jgi:ribosome recycling factor
MAFTFTTLDDGLEKAVSYLQSEYKSLQTGRATPSVLDHVSIEQYGSRMQVTHVASVSLEDNRTLRVSPWEKGVIRDLEKAINEADLGLSVSSDDAGLRVHFPVLTGETRQKMVKILKEKLEDARVKVRAYREEANKEIDKLAKEGDFGEDDKRRFKEEVQKKVDAVNADLESLFESKEKEVLGE